MICSYTYAAPNNIDTVVSPNEQYQTSAFKKVG